MCDFVSRVPAGFGFSVSEVNSLLCGFLDRCRQAELEIPEVTERTPLIVESQPVAEEMPVVRKPFSVPEGFSLETARVSTCKANERKRAAVIAQTVEGYAVCNDCDWLVKIEDHRDRCSVGIMKDKSVTLKAVVGDSLLKYHYLVLMDSSGRDGVQETGRVLSNANQRAYGESLGEPFLSKHLLNSNSSDHSFGTAVELDYYELEEFRPGYLRFCGEISGVEFDPGRVDEVVLRWCSHDGSAKIKSALGETLMRAHHGELSLRVGSTAATAEISWLFQNGRLNDFVHEWFDEEQKRLYGLLPTSSVKTVATALKAAYQDSVAVRKLWVNATLKVVGRSVEESVIEKVLYL